MLWARGAVIVLAGVLAVGCGPPDIPEVAGQELGFARGALESAELDYEVVEVEVDDPDEDGLVQDASYDEDGETVVVEVGSQPTVHLSGEFVLLDDLHLGSSSSEGEPCSGSGGYEDFGSGMDVSVRDQSGTTIGSTRTSGAELVAAGTSDVLYCRTTFELDVEFVDFYEIEVGRRGALSYSYEELEELDFHVELSLG